MVDIEEVLRFFRTLAVQIVAAPLAQALPDPDDLPLLEVAASSGAALVTGNKRHFLSKASSGVQVLDPAELLVALSSR